MTGAKYCAAPISTILALEAIARAKKAGLPVSCGVTINHLTFNEIDISAYDSRFKFQPPVRREEERLALVEAVASGLIDIVFSDHTPQPDAEKQKPFAEAAYGAVGLETLLPAALRLVHAEQIGLPQMLRAMTSRPAEILGLPQGHLALGAPADLICFDPDDPFVLSRDELKSNCKNTPFDRARLQGVVKTTMVGGEIIYSSILEDAHA
jgi:dihydroorotase